MPRALGGAIRFGGGFRVIAGAVDQIDLGLRRRVVGAAIDGRIYADATNKEQSRRAATEGIEHQLDSSMSDSGVRREVRFRKGKPRRELSRFFYRVRVASGPMIRGYLSFIVVIGVFASVVSGMLSAPHSISSSDQAVRSVSTSSPGSWGQRDDAGAADQPADGSVRIEREANGHFYAGVQINGATINALVDTGASGIALSREDARKAGLATSIGMPNVIGEGADGEVYGEIVTLDTVSLGATRAEDLRAMVLNSGEQTLLGQDFLSKFDSVEIRGDTMVLR